MGYHEALAFRRRMEMPTTLPCPTNKRAKCSDAKSELSTKVDDELHNVDFNDFSFLGDEEFSGQGFEEATELDDYGFMSEIYKSEEH